MLSRVHVSWYYWPVTQASAMHCLKPLLRTAYSCAEVCLLIAYAVQGANLVVPLGCYASSVLPQLHILCEVLFADYLPRQKVSLSIVYSNTDACVPALLGCCAGFMWASSTMLDALFAYCIPRSRCMPVGLAAMFAFTASYVCKSCQAYKHSDNDEMMQ